jgi:L-2,4-diaminobutyrate decarboxylase
LLKLPLQNTLWFITSILTPFSHTTMLRGSHDLTETAQTLLKHCIDGRQTVAQQPIVKVLQPDVEAKLQKLAKPKAQSVPLDSVLRDADEIFDYRVRMDHPRFFGFIPSPASDLSWLGDILNTAYNTHAGSWYQSSGTSAVEKSLLNWMAQDVIGFPDSAGGCFVSGGSMANLTALMVARDQKLAFEDRTKAVIYISEQTHSSIAKALRVLGFHNSQISKIECDENFRLRVDALQTAIAEDRLNNKKPFLVIGSCGTTNTGTIDPLEQLAEIAKREDLWLHADGAYGATTALAKRRSSIVKGLELCDSLSWDAHKWLFQTYGCGMVLLRDRKLLVQSFGTSAEYIQDAAEGEEIYPNFWNYGPELTRPARAMKLWFSFQLLGLDAIDAAIERGFCLAEAAEEVLKQLPDWEILSPAQMAIICFRYAPPDHPPELLDDLNRMISKKAIEENLAAPLTTKLYDKVCMRICSIHPDLKNEEMIEIIQGLDRIAKDLSKVSYTLSVL